MNTKTFFANVVVSRDNPELCWEWEGFINPDGYGRTHIAGARGRMAHRTTYELLVGPISDGMTLDHLCRNRSCVNPSHLEQVTPLENYMRGVAVRTHCRNGHEYTPENTAKRGDRLRTCRICERAIHRAYYQRRKERSA